MPDELLLFRSFRVVAAAFGPDWWFLRSCYYRIRMARFHRDVRRFYRLAEGEKKRRLATGVDPEALRLYCLHLADPKREERLLRLAQYLAQGRLELSQEFPSNFT